MMSCTIVLEGYSYTAMIVLPLESISIIYNGGFIAVLASYKMHFRNVDGMVSKGSHYNIFGGVF